MPPAKSARNAEDAKADSNTKEKNGGHMSAAKMRRITSQQGGSNLREVTNASATAAAPVSEPTAPSVRDSQQTSPSPFSHS